MHNEEFSYLVEYLSFVSSGIPNLACHVLLCLERNTIKRKPTYHRESGSCSDCSWRCFLRVSETLFSKFPPKFTFVLSCQLRASNLVRENLREPSGRHEDCGQMGELAQGIRCTQRQSSRTEDEAGVGQRTREVFQQILHICACDSLFPTTFLHVTISLSAGSNCFEVETI
eukprot:368567-Hanusia_phi.AAC.2